MTELLRALLPGAAGRVLDAGTGTGRIARALAPHARRIDAVDPSAEMLRRGRELPGGDHAAIRWLEAPIESAPLDPPYDLAVCAESFHWFDADAALACFAAVLGPHARLALVEGDGPDGEPWRATHVELMIELIERMTGRRPLWRDPAKERRLLVHEGFEFEAAAVTEPVFVEQPLESFVACQHSRQSWALESMGEALAREHDERLRALLEPHADARGLLRYRVRTRVEWGRPRSRGA